MSIVKSIVTALSENPDQPFLDIQNQVISASDFLGHVGARQEQLKAHGVNSGDRVLFTNHRGADFWIDLISLWGIGAVAIPLDRSAPESLTAHIIGMTSPKFVLGELTSAKGAGLKSLILDRQTSNIAFEKLYESESREVSTILFTSGSTGVPKGVPLHASRILQNATSVLKILPLEKGQRLFVPVPFRFVSSISHFLTCALKPATFIGFEENLIGQDLAQKVVEKQGECFGGAPIHAYWLNELAESTPGLNNLSWLMSSGDYLSAEMVEKLNQSLPSLKVFTVYGLTELAGRFCVLDPQFLPDKLGAVGKPIDGLEVTVKDESGARLPSGEVGHVWASGPLVFNGYLKDIENIPHQGAGEFDTGDIGAVDDDGFLYLRGRSDDIFKVSGQKVSKVKIREALMESGLFDDAAVTVAEHPILGNVPHACVVPKDPTTFKKGMALKFLRKQLDDNHLPKGFSLLEKIPRTGSGKVNRQELLRLVDAR